MVNWNELKRRIGNGKLSYIPFYLKHLNNEYLNKSVGGLFWKVNNILNYNLKINQFRYQFKNIKYIGMFVLFCLVYSISLILKRIK